MKFFVLSSFLFFISSSFSQTTQPDFENDSTTHINFWMVDPYASDSATNALYWMIISNLSEDLINAYEDSLKQEQTLRAKRDSTQATNLFGTNTQGQNSDTQIFSPPRDSLKSISLPVPAYSPCNVLYDEVLATQKGVEINYSCDDQMLTAYIYDSVTSDIGKVKWNLYLTKFDTPHVKSIQFSGDDKFDILIELIDKSLYPVNSKNGRVKRFD